MFHSNISLTSNWWVYVILCYFNWAFAKCEICICMQIYIFTNIYMQIHTHTIPLTLNPYAHIYNFQFYIIFHIGTYIQRINYEKEKISKIISCTFTMWKTWQNLTCTYLWVFEIKVKRRKLLLYNDRLVRTNQMPHKIQKQEMLLLLTQLLKCCKKHNFNFRANVYTCNYHTMTITRYGMSFFNFIMNTQYKFDLL